MRALPPLSRTRTRSSYDKQIITEHLKVTDIQHRDNFLNCNFGVNSRVDRIVQISIFSLPISCHQTLEYSQRMSSRTASGHAKSRFKRSNHTGAINNNGNGVIFSIEAQVSTTRNQHPAASTYFSHTIQGGLFTPYIVVHLAWAGLDAN